MTVKQRRELTKNRNHKRQIRAQYVYGNAVLNPRKVQDSRATLRPVNEKIRKTDNRRKAGNAGYVIFLTLMMCLCGYFCLNYLQLTSTISNDLAEIAKLEADLNSLRADNDDYENRINGSVDIEAIKKKAMKDLGMQYAKDDQIITYESDDTDYVRQYIILDN